MRLIFAFFKFVFLLFLLLMVIALFLPSSAHIERSLMVDAVPEIPYHLVNRLSAWENWSPWHKLDPEMKISYSGPPEGEGASYSWTSTHREVGNGKQSIVSAKSAEFVLMDMAFAEGGPARCGFYFQKTEAGTEVKWTFDSDVGWNLPGRYFLLMMDYFVGPHFEEGLVNLSAESRKIVSRGYTMGFETADFPGMDVIGLRNSGKENEISTALGLMYQTVLTNLSTLNLQMSGPPLAIYETPVNGFFHFFAGIPVSGKPDSTIPAGLEYMNIPSGKTLLCRFNGPYQKAAAAYKQFQIEMKARKLQPAGNPWESYITDPASVKNPLEIQTEIYWPVR